MRLVAKIINRFPEIAIGLMVVFGIVVAGLVNHFIK